MPLLKLRYSTSRSRVSSAPSGNSRRAAVLDDGVGEQPVLDDQSGADHRVAEGDAAGDDEVSGSSFSARTRWIGFPARTVVCCQPGSVSVEETTYLCTRSGAQFHGPSPVSSGLRRARGISPRSSSGGPAETLP